MECYSSVYGLGYFLKSLEYEHMGGLHVWVTVNIAAINIGVQMPLLQITFTSRVCPAVIESYGSYVFKFYEMSLQYCLCNGILI